ncbi:hypothetical protein [Alkalibacillus haloalkaliphilus]|uniref:hypothetical protein n=1 Tax=Alkalibacillus haloalkaliphilus TaxID=94136 RepID=UPI00147833E6|nr:hypothetical protein [Alkalibacillus haloalkaliphilus]
MARIIWRSCLVFWRSGKLSGARDWYFGAQGNYLALAIGILAFRKIIWRSRLVFWRSGKLFGARDWYFGAREINLAFTDFIWRSRNFISVRDDFIGTHGNLSELGMILSALTSIYQRSHHKNKKRAFIAYGNERSFSFYSSDSINEANVVIA